MNTLNIKLRVFLYSFVLSTKSSKNLTNKAKPSNKYPDKVINTLIANGSNAKATIIKSIVIQ